MDLSTPTAWVHRVAHVARQDVGQWFPQRIGLHGFGQATVGRLDGGSSMSDRPFPTDHLAMAVKLRSAEVKWNREEKSTRFRRPRTIGWRVEGAEASACARMRRAKRSRVQCLRREAPPAGRHRMRRSHTVAVPRDVLRRGQASGDGGDGDSQSHLGSAWAHCQGASSIGGQRCRCTQSRGWSAPGDITSLRTPEGHHISSSDSIKQHAAEHYAGVIDQSPSDPATQQAAATLSTQVAADSVCDLVAAAGTFALSVAQAMIHPCRMTHRR